MNKLRMVVVISLVASSVSAMSIAEARGKIGDVIVDPSQMTAVMKQLSVADQKSFVADVNDSIARFPGSSEERSAKVINVTRAALKGADRKNPKSLESLIAEVFATVPVESLCALNESLAKDAFNRGADARKTYTDDQFVRIASNLVSAVNARVSGMEDGVERGAFAALMMIRASNGSPASLPDDLAALFGERGEEVRKEWFAEALRSPANYDPMLAGTSVFRGPDVRSVILLAGAQTHDALLSSFYQGNQADPVSVCNSRVVGDMSETHSFDNGVYTRPRTLEEKPWNPDNGPQPYFGQTIRAQSNQNATHVVVPNQRYIVNCDGWSNK